MRSSLFRNVFIVFGPVWKPIKEGTLRNTIFVCILKLSKRSSENKTHTQSPLEKKSTAHSVPQATVSMTNAEIAGKEVKTAKLRTKLSSLEISSTGRLTNMNTHCWPTWLSSFNVFQERDIISAQGWASDTPTCLKVDVSEQKP